jgi:kumamolisin
MQINDGRPTPRANPTIGVPQQATTSDPGVELQETFCKGLAPLNPAPESPTRAEPTVSGSRSNAKSDASNLSTPATTRIDDPRQVAQAYNCPQDTDGAGQTIAIVELGGGYKQADLDSYFRSLHMDTPHFHAVSVDGAQNSPVGDPASDDAEVDLDLEVAGAVAPKADIPVYFAPNTAKGFMDSVREAVAAQLDAGKPGAVSVSWGSAENGVFSADEQAAFGKVLDDAAAHGVNVYVASGDGGCSDDVGDGKDHVDFPAVSPSVISTGGTKLQLGHDGTRSKEVAWGGEVGGASGGGFSIANQEPDYQVKAKINDPTGRRGVPDLAGNAAPDSTYAIMVDGQTVTGQGQTSGVAPLMAALDARERQAVGGNIGFLNPTLYAHPEVFTDVTEGTNGSFQAAPGWDPVTGLGVPDGEKLAAVLRAQHQA